MWNRLLWIAVVYQLSKFHIARGLEGSFFYVTFMRNHEHVNITQEISVTSSTDGKVNIQYNFPSNNVETIQLNSGNSREYVRRIETAEADLCPPLNVTTKAAIVIYSTMNISVRANSIKLGSAGGYLSLPLTTSSTRFYLASYKSSTGYQYTEFSIISPYNDTSVAVNDVSGSKIIEILKLTMSENDVYQSGLLLPADYTGLHVTSDKPIAVFSGHSCANVPQIMGGCDHIIEQMPPVSQWGKTFIMASFYGRSFAAGFVIRVIAQTPTNVTYWVQTYDSNNDPLDFTMFRSVNVFNGHWDEAVINSTSNNIVVLVKCSFDCLVMQYNKGVHAGNSTDLGDPDPFMVTVPSLDHYTNDIKFSTSQYTEGTVLKEYYNGITVIAKVMDLEKIYLDNSQIINIAGGKQYGIKINESANYTAVIAPIDPGFHSVTATDPSVKYAVFVYGHAHDGEAASFGYLGGYGYIYGANDHPIAPPEIVSTATMITGEPFAICIFVVACQIIKPFAPKTLL